MSLTDRVQRVSMYIFLFSLGFEAWDPFNTDGGLSVSRLTGFFYVFTILPWFTWFFKTSRIRSFLLPIWLFFALLTLVSIFNINRISADFFQPSIFQCMLLFWFLVNHERKDRMVMEKGMLFFALGTGAMALFFSLGIGISYEEGGRLSILGENQNVIGIKMCISLIVLFLAIVQNRLRLGAARFLLILPIPLMLRVLAETASRVAFISFSLAFVSGVLFLRTKKIWGKIVVFAAGIPTSLFLWQILVTSETLTKRLLQTSETGDLADRDIIWQSLIPLIKANWIFGVGLTGYWKYARTSVMHEQEPHNVFLEVLCYTGVIGLFLYLLFLFRVLNCCYQMYKSDGILLPFLLMVPIFGLLLSAQLLEVKIGWVIFAYIVGSSAFRNGKQNLGRAARRRGSTIIGKTLGRPVVPNAETRS